MGNTKLVSRRAFCKYLFGAVVMPGSFVNQIGSTQIWQKKKQFSKKEGSNILVLYYSFSGNTEIMAKEIAIRYQADLVEILAEEYSDNLSGSILANSDAWNEVRDAAITPQTLDLSSYRIIFLGSPIWWYRPAVPLWAFTEKNNFQGQEVILFNTFNSRFKDNHINKFSDLVQANGGRLNDHIFVRRGRWYDQMDQHELIEGIQKLLKSKENRWKFRSRLSA